MNATSVGGADTRSYFMSLYHVLLACVFLLTWFDPFLFGERMVRHCVYSVFIELFGVQSLWMLMLLNNMSVPARTKRLMIYVVVLLYGCCISALCFDEGSIWPLLALLILVFPKALQWGTRPLNRGTSEWKAFIRHQITTTILFFALLIVMLLIPVPRLGIDNDVIMLQAFVAGGPLIEEPQRALAFGSAYFAFLSLGILFTAKH